MIDIHTHLNITGRLPGDGPPLTAEQLIDRMNREGVDQSCLLPCESPEVSARPFVHEEAISACHRYPERLILFISVDPRAPRCVELIQHYAATYDVKGFGEVKNSLAFDDPLHKQIYAKCNELGLPLLFHSDPTLCWDEVGLPRLEACLQEFPKVSFIGHGPGWWAAISADDDRSGGYPKDPIKPTGAIDRLLGDYANLYADISAGSGYNALTRDSDFTVGFLERHWRKLLFGTDYLRPGQELRQFEWLRSAPLSDEQRGAIADGNARRILGLD
jgi:hypothetical protein